MISQVFCYRGYFAALRQLWHLKAEPRSHLFLPVAPFPTPGCCVTAPARCPARCGTAGTRCQRFPCWTAWLAARQRRQQQSRPQQASASGFLCLPCAALHHMRKNADAWLWICQPMHWHTQSPEPRTCPSQPRLHRRVEIQPADTYGPRRSRRKPSAKRQHAATRPPTPCASPAALRFPSHANRTQLPINKHSTTAPRLNVSSPQPFGLNIGIGSAPGGGTSGFRLKQIVMNPICSVNMLSECFFL